MSDKVDQNLQRKVWIGIFIFLSLFWGSVAYLIVRFFI
ncbi:YmiA family putative membrane protein [Klebsiella aerogenes]